MIESSKLHVVLYFSCDMRTKFLDNPPNGGPKLSGGLVYSQLIRKAIPTLALTINLTLVLTLTLTLTLTYHLTSSNELTWGRDDCHPVNCCSVRNFVCK